MSIGSFSTSLSGLNANQQKLNVIGNNLANINTVGYKASNTAFADLVSQSVAGTSINPMQIGLGVSIGSIAPDFSQGGIEDTGISTNAALQGNGFFVVGTTPRTYTRAGDFGLNSAGVLTTPDGRPVQGYTSVDPITGTIITTGAVSTISVPPGVLRPPVATTSIGTVSNLNSSAPVGSTFTTTVQVYDTLGVPHATTITYTKSPGNAWAYAITVPGADVVGGTAGVPSQIAAGTLTFDGQGRLATLNGAAPADLLITPPPAWSNGAAATNLTWDLVDANGVPTLTGFSSASATGSISQNGAPPGTVESIRIDPGGKIIGTFGAGRTVVIGQLAIATFNNPQGLVKVGTNQYDESESSGLANIGIAGTGGRGTVIGSALEQSNVDIAQEFTQMILAQRGYQANSKSITVADELLLDTLNLKR